MRYSDREGRELKVTVTKYGMVVPVPTEALFDAGVFHDTRPVAKRSFRQRVTTWFVTSSQRVNVKIASWLVGYDVEDRDWG